MSSTIKSKISTTRVAGTCVKGLSVKGLCVAGVISLSSAVHAATQDTYTTNLYWGDTHLHTPYSFDAFLNGNYEGSPDDPYRWAKGEPVVHPYAKTRVQIGTPLDFLVVSDHAESLGMVRGVVNDTAELTDIGLIGGFKRWAMIKYVKNAVANDEGPSVFKEIMPKPPAGSGEGDPVKDPNNDHYNNDWGDPTPTVKDAWSQLMDAADRNYEPGTFTTMVGWEWTSTPIGVNLHRVVVSSSSGEEAKQYIPFGADQSQYPEDLWAWLDKTEKETGLQFISIPHNSNISKGYMFPETTIKGKTITAEYAKRRIKFEPVVEMTQIKGDSEAHPEISTNDEFADFETYQYFLQGDKSAFNKVFENDYVRGALTQGMKLEQQTGVNPYKFGMIGSTDAHTSVASAEEDNFWGKMSIDSLPNNKNLGGKGGIPGATGWDMAAAGLAAVWAPENTREAIFAAFKRKEVYATSGPRIAVRFFGGWEFGELESDASNITDMGYGQGTPMGGDLSVKSEDKAQPEFLIQAIRDPVGANLDRVQVVKGWVDSAGQSQEKIYNVAWSDERELNADGRLPAVGDTVNRKTGEVANSIGTPELITKWTDPDFDPALPAFYYVRVLQIPTARHSLLDTVALGVPHPENLPEVIQERAYTSPIWYTP
jgi:hypothetical protein